MHCNSPAPVIYLTLEECHFVSALFTGVGGLGAGWREIPTVVRGE
jgi:hypothetical protein